MSVNPNDRFGKLLVVGRAKGLFNRGNYWKCLCECGTTKAIRGDALTSGRVVSCGCFHKEKVRAVHTRHGDTGTRFHSIFLDIHSRCYNKTATGYKWYGERGIKVCPHWHIYENFKEDMYTAYLDHFRLYSLDTQIDRIDNTGDYTPTNCRWTTQSEQRSNTSRTRKFVATAPWGETFIESNQIRFAAVHGLSHSGVCNCLNGKQTHHKGWTFKPLDRR